MWKKKEAMLSRRILVLNNIVWIFTTSNSSCAPILKHSSELKPECVISQIKLHEHLIILMLISV